MDGELQAGVYPCGCQAVTARSADSASRTVGALATSVPTFAEMLRREPLTKACPTKSSSRFTRRVVSNSRQYRRAPRRSDGSAIPSRIDVGKFEEQMRVDAGCLRSARSMSPRCRGPGSAGPFTGCTIERFDLGDPTRQAPSRAGLDRRPDIGKFFLQTLRDVKRRSRRAVHEVWKTGMARQCAVAPREPIAICIFNDAQTYELSRRDLVWSERHRRYPSSAAPLGFAGSRNDGANRRE